MIYKDPFHNSLRTHPIEKAQEGVYSAELDDNYRVIFRHIKPDHILLFWVDKHDPAYDKAARTSVTIEDGKIKILETVESETRLSTQQPLYHTRPVGLLFARWNDEELFKLGLSADWLPAFRQMNTLNEFQYAEGQVPESVFDALLNFLLESEEPKEGTAVSDTQLKIALSQPETRKIYTSLKLVRNLRKPWLVLWPSGCYSFIRRKSSWLNQTSMAQHESKAAQAQEKR